MNMKFSILAFFIAPLIFSPIAGAQDFIKTRAGNLRIEGGNGQSKLMLDNKELKRGAGVFYGLPETFQSRFEINGADVFIFSAYTTPICHYFFLVQIPSKPKKPKVFKEQTHILCGDDDNLEIYQSENSLKLTVPQGYDPKSKNMVDVEYKYNIEN